MQVTWITLYNNPFVFYLFHDKSICFNYCHLNFNDLYAEYFDTCRSPVVPALNNSVITTDLQTIRDLDRRIWFTSDLRYACSRGQHSWMLQVERTINGRREYCKKKAGMVIPGVEAFTFDARTPLEFCSFSAGPSATSPWYLRDARPNRYAKNADLLSLRYIYRLAVAFISFAKTPGHENRQRVRVHVQNLFSRAWESCELPFNLLTVLLANDEYTRLARKLSYNLSL